MERSCNRPRRHAFSIGHKRDISFLGCPGELQRYVDEATMSAGSMSRSGLAWGALRTQRLPVAFSPAVFGPKG